jgi:uncharacterized surface protein with fasciclin (FAS1) repeats
MKMIRLAIIGIIMLSMPAAVLAGSYGSSANKAADMASMDIVDTAVGAGSFTTLVTALQAADLVDTLKGPGPFTVFAPTDEAFAKLPTGTVENLLKPENKGKLQAILTYHVVPGKVMSADAATLTTAKTVNGQSFKVSKSDSGLMVDQAHITQADIVTSNGVIHVIDEVIIPE